MHAIYATPVISIHAPTRGATYNGAKYFIHCADFNPRSHEGSDRSTGRLSTVLCISIHAPTRGATWQTNEMQKSHKISIHAPTRGATYAQSATENVDVYFNPRSHEGSDKPPIPSKQEKELFQSTLPRGERQSNIVQKQT